MSISEISQMMGGLILTFANIPQIIQIIKTKQVEGLNLTMFFSFFIGVCLTEVYAIELFLKNVTMVLFITNSIAVFLNGFMAFSILYYRKRASKPSLLSSSKNL